MAVDINFEKLVVGYEFPPLTKEPISEVQLVKYAGASGDFNPIHTVQHIAQEAKLGGVIAHGMLIMGFVGQAIASWIPNNCIKKFNVQFRGMTRPNDVITVYGSIKDKISENNCEKIVCEVTAKDDNGGVKIKGSFEAEIS